MKKNLFLIQPIIAHKGLYDNQKGIPENTIPAFKLALEKGYTIELDVHVLKDNTVVVFHDDTLIRAAKIPKKIKDYTYEELKEISIFDTSFTIPTLQEVLQLVEGKVGILIELKNDVLVGRLEKEVTRLLQNYKGNFAIQSFDPFRVMWFHIHKPKWIRGQLVVDFANERIGWITKRMIKVIINNPFTNPDFLSCSVLVIENEEIQKIRKQKSILGWTIETKKEYQKYKPYADNFICDIKEKKE